MTPRAVIDVQAIREALFAGSSMREKIGKLYAVTPSLSPDHFEAALLESFEQVELEPEATGHNNSVVFRAAVRAIASNSRSWATFLKGESTLSSLLGRYNPSVANCLNDNETAKIRTLLPGITSRKDTKAIMDWAQLLTGGNSYNGHLLAVRKRVRKCASANGLALNEPEMTAAVALLIGTAPLRFVTEAEAAYPLKAPGMGFPLASEFLRNLGWPGFKPDRHIIRLLTSWFGEVPATRERARLLAASIGIKAPATINLLYFSMLGADRSPAGLPISKVDQLVWLYGAVYEKKAAPVPSRKPSTSSSSSAASPSTERMSHKEARSILTDLWSRKQVDAAEAGNEMEKAKRLREVEALSVAMTALEVLGD